MGCDSNSEITTLGLRPNHSEAALKAGRLGPRQVHNVGQFRCDTTADCETLEQLGCRSSPAICLFCQQPSINTFLNKQLLGSTFPSLIYIHTLTSPFPRIKMVWGGHRRHMPEPDKGIFVTMSRQLSSKDISIRYTWHWCMPQTNTCLSCNGNPAALSFRNPSGKSHHVWHHASHPNHTQPHSRKQWWGHYTSGGDSADTITCGTTT